LALQDGGLFVIFKTISGREVEINSDDVFRVTLDDIGVSTISIKVEIETAMAIMDEKFEPRKIKAADNQKH
tara:strand:+ start:731 stop:943 length:213 start_codon:yes stop_codon:yes gene_type:complete